MIITSSSVLKKLLLLFLVLAGLYYAKNFLIPLAIGTVLATLFLPLCNWLEEKKLPKGLAVTACLLLLLVVIAGIGVILGWQISALAKEFAVIKQKFVEIGNEIQEFIFDNIGISLEKQDQVLSEQEPLLTFMLKDVAFSLPSIFTTFILIMVYVLFLLYYRSHMKQFLLKLSSPSQHNEMEKVIYRVAHVSQQYLVGLSKMIVCLWVMYGIGFSIIGIKHALFFAFLCGLLEIIPFIGNITGTTITLLVAAVQGATLPILIGITGTYGLVQFIQGWVLEPLIVGSQVKINPLFIIIALVIGGLIWGIPGIFLAIPLMAMFKIVCDHVEPLKPYGFLIGETQSKKREPTYIMKIKKWVNGK